MTDTQILNKAMSKAYGYPFDCVVFSEIILNNNYYRIIFSRKFAKAFWGELKINSNNEGYDLIENMGWIHHQHRMLVEIQKGKNPLKYLEKFL